MAKKQAQKSTKSTLVKEIEFKIQELTLLLSALQSERSRSEEKLADYQTHYQHILGKD